MVVSTHTFKEACDLTGYKPSVIRFYEKEFKINIPRDINGRRFFTQKEIDRLLMIKKLQQEGYTNKQIKKLIEEKRIDILYEIAASVENTEDSAKKIADVSCIENNIAKVIDDKMKEINDRLNELNQNVTGKERDILITENMKLKMELKQRAYEIMELKEKLKYEKDKGKGFFKRFF